MLHINPALNPNAKDDKKKPLRALDYFEQIQIFPGSKVSHFTKIHQATGLKYEDMLFFDGKSTELLRMTPWEDYTLDIQHA